MGKGGGEMEKKRRKSVKGKVKIENGRRGKFQNEQRTPFFFFFFFLQRGKNRKNNFAPSKKFSCYGPDLSSIYFPTCS